MTAGAFRVERNLQIPMEDGTLLAADGWFPEAEAPSPALLGFYPYHKEAGNGAYFEYANRWFAERGFASLIVDLRGTGCSGGSVADPFGVRREGGDGAAAVEWAAAQPWCDGSVAVWGMSYGGITALSIAAERPRALRAIAPVMACADMYHDWFWPGGCEAAQTTTFWGTTMVALQLAPPICEDPDARFLRQWRERLLDRDPFLLPWRRHPEYDSFWVDRTTDLSRIEVPAFLIGGWHDVYREATFRAYELIDAPCRLLIGPWLHELPDQADEEPVEYLEELTRWWNRWLRPQDGGSEDEPPVTLYVQGRGIWRGEADWPPPTAEERTLFLTAEGGLEARCASEATAVSYDADPTVGACAGHIYAGGRPLDQGDDDLRSLAWTTDPVAEPLEIGGSPEVLLRVAPQRPGNVDLVVRLCDVAPNGASTLIATGSARVAGGAGPGAADEKARPLAARVPIAASCYRLAPGHRLRISLACADFPRLWPTFENPRIDVLTGGELASRVHLPVNTGDAPPIEPKRPDPSLDRGPRLVDSSSRWTVERAPAAGGLTVSLTQRSVSRCGTAREEMEQMTSASVATDRPASARIATTVRIQRQLPGGAEAHVRVDSVATPHRTACSGRVTFDGLVVFDRSWWLEG